MVHVTKGDLGAIKVPVPSAEEQTAIASFLDRETGKIDALIAEQEKLLTLLAEKRQATISQAVTRGLNPHVPMKDSGVPWLGEVPEDWTVCAVKRMTTVITDGAHISPETDGGIYDFVSTKDVSDSGIDFESSLKTSASSYEYLVRNGCKPKLGDVLFSKDGTIGRTVVVEEEREFVVASSLIIMRPDATLLDGLFLHYLCQSFVVRQQVDGFVKGAGLPRLSIQNLTKVLGVFPSLPEQHGIAQFLEVADNKWSALKTNAERAIALLKERRSAMIAAAVTGKIDVRQVA
jgi:type I restriction enzyme S subunit